MTRFSLDDFVSYRDDDGHVESDDDDCDSDSDGSSLSYTDTSTSSSDSYYDDDIEEELKHPLGFGTTRLGLFNRDTFRPRMVENYYDGDGDGDGDDVDPLDDLGTFFSPSFVLGSSRLRFSSTSTSALPQNSRETKTLLKHHYRTFQRRSTSPHPEAAVESNQKYDDDGMTSLMDGMDRIAYLVRVATMVQQQGIPPQLQPPLPSSTTSNKLELLLKAAEEERKSQQRVQREMQEYKRQLSQAQKKDAELLLSLIERDQDVAGRILQREARQEEERLERQRIEEEVRNEKDRKRREEEERIEQMKRDEEEEVARKEARKAEQEEAKEKLRQKELRQHREEREAAKAKKTEYVTNAKTMVHKLGAVRKSLEFFETSKDRAISKRRLQMKKIARGKMNTLSHDRGKIEQVVVHILQAFQTNTTEDMQIKQQMANGNASVTKDMTRGTRYLMDLIASTTIVRVQAEGFNGTRGDGFPLAHMLAHVAKNASKDFNILITAHIYSVCPTAIPTLPSPEPGCSETELMESLGMQKDKNGEYESFDRFLARTEGIISIMAQIMCSKPSDHILFSGHRGALKWLTRFLDLIPSEQSPLPLLTAPVLVAFLTAAGHMLANKFPDQFSPMLDVITNDISKRLDNTTIGQPSATRLSKLLSGGIQVFQSKLPQGAIRDFYDSQGPSTLCVPANVPLPTPSSPAPSMPSNQHSSQTTQVGMETQSSATSTNAFQMSPFPANTSEPSQFGRTSFPSTSAGTFDNDTNSMNVVSNVALGDSNNAGGSNPFGTNQNSLTNPNTTTAPFGNPSAQANPFGASNVAPTAPTSSFGGGAVPIQSPFGTANLSVPPPFGASNAAPGLSPFGATAPVPSPFGAPTPGPPPFGTAAPGPSPFVTAAPVPSPFGTAAPVPSPFGGSAPVPSPFGNTAPGPGAVTSPFGNSTNLFETSVNHGSTSAFGGNNSNNFNNEAPFGSSGGQQQKKPCRFFAQGNCRFGDKCKYSHDINIGGSNRKSFNGGNFSSTSNPSPFGTSGGFGNNQGNVAVPPPFGAGGYSKQNNTGDKKKPCIFFAQGKCKYGNRCKFSHEINGQGNPDAYGSGGFNSTPAPSPFTGGGPFGSRW